MNAITFNSNKVRLTQKARQALHTTVGEYVNIVTATGQYVRLAVRRSLKANTGICNSIAAAHGILAIGLPTETFERLGIAPGAIVALHAGSSTERPTITASPATALLAAPDETPAATASETETTAGKKLALWERIENAKPGAILEVSESQAKSGAYEAAKRANRKISKVDATHIKVA